MDKPKLVLHPGFAKCATSTLQHQFKKNDFSLCRALDLVWLGRSFKPFNGDAPVYDVVQGADAVKGMLKGAYFEPINTYFISAEDLINHKDVLGVLSERFSFVNSICTVRLPLFIALSEFYFRGWLTRSLQESLASGIDDLQLRLMRKIDVFCAEFGRRVILCPIEQEDFLSDFCMHLLGEGHPSDKVGVSKEQRTNNSAHPCFVVALKHEYLRLGAPDLKPLARRMLIKRVQEYPVKTEVGDYLPEDVLITLDDKARISQHVDSYLGWLLRFGCSESKLGEVRAKINKRICLELSKKSCPSRVQEELQVEARELLQAAGVA